MCPFKNACGFILAILCVIYNVYRIVTQSEKRHNCPPQRIRFIPHGVGAGHHLRYRTGHGCQMAKAGLLDRMCLALRAGRTMAPLCCAAKFDPFLSLHELRPHTLHPGAIQGKEGIKFCHLATMRTGHQVVSAGGHDHVHQR